MEKQAFIDYVKAGAIKGMQQYGILASLTIAQAILESGWGRYAPGNNLFGIKWANGYASQTLTTHEYVNGKRITIDDQFRAYSSWADSVEDHALFLKQNSRYSNLLGIKDYELACKLIQQDGYATDINYTKMLIQLIEQNNLTKYDVVNNGWHQISGTWYYFENNVKVINHWRMDTAKKFWYFLSGDGSMATNRWIKWNDGKQYWVGKDGLMATDTLIDGWYVDTTGAWDNKAQIK